MYTVPLVIALVSWLSATVINVSCSSIACKVNASLDCFINVSSVIGKS